MLTKSGRIFPDLRSDLSHVCLVVADYVGQPTEAYRALTCLLECSTLC